MELVINRIKYEIPERKNFKLILSTEDDLLFGIQLGYVRERFNSTELKAVNKWAELNDTKDDSYIYYGFVENSQETYLELAYNDKFKKDFTIWLLSNHFKKSGFYVYLKPIGLDLSCYELVRSYNEEWDIYQRWDFKLDYRNNQLIFNLGSSTSYISKNEIQLDDELGNLSCILSDGYVRKSKYIELIKSRVIANWYLKQTYNLESLRNPINYTKRYKELQQFFNAILKLSKEVVFHSIGFDSIRAETVNFSHNKMLFRNGATDINPIAGMRNYGVYQDAPNALEKQFIFIYQHNDDANTLYKYLKAGYKGFPGLQPYVNIPLTLANSIEKGKFKRMEYADIKDLLEKYQDFEKYELPDEYYSNMFAIVIGPFDKNEPCQEYYDLKLSLIKKGIPSQFINYKNIRKSGVFNYHLPNIAIGIHAKLGGIPWRLDRPKKQELVIGFNQIISGKEKFIGSTVFFDNQGRLKRTHSFGEQNSSNEIIALLKRALEDYLAQETSIQRLVIHYHKSLSQKEQGHIERILRKELNLSIPYAVVEVNDTKSRLELGFDPDYNYRMPTSGNFVRLTNKEYLLFNNNRFKAVAPVGVKDELPLKLKIHFADESGFSHRELIEQVYEFSRLIWKGLKQRSQPATCFYAKEIAVFKSAVSEPIPDNHLTQTTPWVI